MLIPAPLRSLVNMSGPLQQGIAAGQSVFEILDQPTEGSGGTAALARARGEIEFRNVSFAYSGREGRGAARCELSRAPGRNRGHRRAVPAAARPRWSAWCRASTIVRQGAVLLDGVDVRDYRLTDLRSQVSLVSQDVVLFNDTIRNNIAFNAVGKTRCRRWRRRRAPPTSWNSSRSSRRGSTRR